MDTFLRSEANVDSDCCQNQCAVTYQDSQRHWFANCDPDADANNSGDGDTYQHRDDARDTYDDNGCDADCHCHTHCHYHRDGDAGANRPASYRTCANKFGRVKVGRTSAERLVRLANPARNKSPVMITSLGLESQMMSEPATGFSIDATRSSCHAGDSIARGKSCTVYIAFAPPAVWGEESFRNNRKPRPTIWSSPAISPIAATMSHCSASVTD